MTSRSIRRRKFVDYVVKVLSACAALLGIFFLAWILIVVMRRGAAAINWDFFLKKVAPPGVEGGGIGNAILGSFYMLLGAVIIGVPIGLLAGAYLAEFGRHSRLGAIIRFSANVLMGIPSIIVGLFVYALVVMRMGHFSGWAGSFALAILMLPIIARTTEDMLVLVPNSLRESALALGAPRWKVTMGVVFRAAKAGLLTGVLLAVARISGETAPLLFTALNNPYWPWPMPGAMNGPTANLTVTIFNYAMSPYADWQQLAWGASLIITVGILALNITTRLLFKKESYG